MKNNKKLDFITKKHLKNMNIEIGSELNDFNINNTSDYFDYENEFTLLENKFVGGNTTKQTLNIFKERF